MGIDETEKGSPVVQTDSESLPSETASIELINASGHKQELERNFSLLSMSAIAVTTGNTWIAVGGTIVISLFNGGPSGVIYEFIVVSVLYWFVAASIAELASSMPSASGVYQWASVTGGKHGRVAGFFAGWWNFLAWVFGAASIAALLANMTISMYTLYHPDYAQASWHVFISYLICVWLCCGLVMFGNRALPTAAGIGGFLVIAGVLVTIIVCAIMPHVNGTGYATNAFVWKDWVNTSGYTSNGFVFVLGMMNGAYSVGTPDCVSHLAEEIPHPSRNIPKAMFLQYAIGFFTSLFFLIAIFYSITDLQVILDSGSTFPLAPIYYQATGSNAGATGLVIICFLCTALCCTGCFVTASRCFWTLARDNATPFPKIFAQVHPTQHNPLNAVILCGVLATVLGLIYVGSAAAFTAFVGSFIILSTLSYLTAILPHLLSGRSNIEPGWFWMKGAIGYVVNIISCLYIIVFIVIFCFPFAAPFELAYMNWNSLITGGLTMFIIAFWFYRQKDYVGPRHIKLEEIKAVDAAL